MKPIYFCGLLVALVAGLQLSQAAGAEIKRLGSQPGSSVTINGGNNLHDWQIRGDVIEGKFELGTGFPISTNQTVEVGREVPARMIGAIPVRSLRHEHVKIFNRILYEKLQETRYPYIQFRFANLTLTRKPTVADPAFVFEADCDLVVAGVTNASVLPISIKPLGNLEYEITGALTVKMSDFKITPPKVETTSGAIKTRDSVDIEFKWRMGPETRPSAFKPSGGVPPFVAMGTITSSNWYSRTEAKFRFFASNDWWQVELFDFISPPNYEAQNCMRIPGGVRTFTLFHNETNSPAAEACPIPYPPPGQAGGQFECWLALCPNLPLPLIDETRMHQFLTVPSAPFDVLDDPINQATFHAEFLQPGGQFLSSLNITNDGVAIVWNPEGIELHRYPPPFDNGFVELEYRVETSTNLHGITFPLKATLNHFGINYRDRTERGIVTACDIAVTKISFDEAELAQQEHPELLHVIDYRPRGLETERLVNRVIARDQWTTAPR